MDPNTLNLNFGEGDVEKLREIAKRMGKLIADIEGADERMERRQREIEATTAQHQALLNQQLQAIRTVTSELEELMTEAGVARLRINTESALQQGQAHLQQLKQLSQDHLQAIQESTDEFNKLAKKTFDRLDRASIYTIKGISEAVSSFRIGDFQRLTEQSCSIVEETSNKAITRLGGFVQGMHWKSLGFAFAVTVFASVTIGLYLSDEMPWETHKRVVAQRRAGEALLNSWHSLSESERQHILQHTHQGDTIQRTGQA
jgi:ElaB/YqjD/DUF883 family membrane-anchored ribosome-binding protein